MSDPIITTLENQVENVIKDVEDFFSQKAEPAVEKSILAVENVVSVWAKQFETDFGKSALAAAVTVVNGLATGGLSAVPAVAEAAGAALVQQGISIAEQDAQTVLLNAARTAINAASIPAAAPAAPVEPAAPAAPSA